MSAMSEIATTIDQLIAQLPETERLALARRLLGANNAPPPHWTDKDPFDRHPKTPAAWDWRNDQVGFSVDASERRLNFAGDKADPRVPDQMALVLRLDLGRILGKLTWRTAQSEARGRLLATSQADGAALRRLRDDLHATSNRYLARARSVEAERDEAREISGVFADHWPYGADNARDAKLRLALCAVTPASDRSAQGGEHG